MGSRLLALALTLPAVVAQTTGAYLNEAYAIRADIWEGDPRVRDAGLASAIELLQELEGCALAEPPDELDVDYVECVTAYTVVSFDVCAWIPSRLPDARSAIDQYRLCIDLVERMHARGWIHADNVVDAELRLGKALVQAGRLEEAQASLAATARRYPGDRSVLPSVLLELSQLASHRGDILEALRRAELALALLDRYDPDSTYSGRVPVWRCAVLGRLGDVALLMGLPDRAAESFALEAELAKRLGRTGLLANALIHEASLLLATERYLSLERATSEALAGATLAAAPRARVKVRLCRAVGRSVQARDGGESAEPAFADLEAVLTDRYADASDRLKAATWKADLSIRTGAPEEARTILDAIGEQLGQASLAPQALGPLEDGAFAAALAAKLARVEERPRAELGDALRDLDAAFDRFLAQWATTPIRPGGIGFLHSRARRQVLGELVQLTLDVHPEEEGLPRVLERLVRVECMSSMVRAHLAEPVASALGAWFVGARPTPVAWADLAVVARRALRFRSLPVREVRDRIGAGEAGVLLFLPSPDTSHVFAFDDEGVHHWRLAGESELERDRVRYVDEVSVPPSSSSPSVERADGLGRALADALLPEDLRERMRTWPSIVAVGLDLLGYTPLEALPWDPDRPLGEVFAVSYLPSLSIGALLRERAAAETSAALDLFLVAAPRIGEPARELSPDLRAIPYDASVERRLVAPFDERRIRSFSKGEATAAVFERTELSRARALLFLGHGIVDPARERAAGLVVTPSDANDGLLWAEDLEALALPPLTILAACEAGWGRERKGEAGMTHLGSACLQAGSRTVLVSPAKIDYRRTVEITALFLERVAAGEPPARALQSARRELARDSQRAHPFFSLVHIHGLGETPLF